MSLQNDVDIKIIRNKITINMRYMAKGNFMFCTTLCLLYFLNLVIFCISYFFYFSVFQNIANA